MSLVTRFTTSWQIFRSSLSLIRSQPKLLLFPFVTGTLSVLIAGFFLAMPVSLLFTVPGFQEQFSPEHVRAAFHTHDWTGFWANFSGNQTLAYLDHEYGLRNLKAGMSVFGMLLFTAMVFVSSFCSVAFYHQVMRAFGGGDVSLREGLAFAWSRVRAIAMWSLLAATVGLLIQAIAERVGFLQGLIIRFLGAAFSIASIFAIPVLVRQDCRNPVKVLKTSVSTLRATWGESLIGYMGMDMLSSIVVVCSIVALAAGIVALAVAQFYVSIVFLVLGFICWMILFGVFMSVAGQIYRCALYIFATEGVVPGPFDQAMLDAAWKLKKA